MFLELTTVGSVGYRMFRISDNRRRLYYIVLYDYTIHRVRGFFCFFFFPLIIIRFICNVYLFFLFHLGFFFLFYTILEIVTQTRRVASHRPGKSTVGIVCEIIPTKCPSCTWCDPFAVRKRIIPV